MSTLGSAIRVPLLIVLLASGPAARAEDLPTAEALLGKLLAAEKSRDYAAFVADGTDQLKTALSKAQFEASADSLKPKLAAGYETTLLGVLNQRGFEVYLYRLRFQDGSDDILATLSLKENKVGGIYFH